MVLEEELRVLNLDWQAAGRDNDPRSLGLSVKSLKTHPLTSGTLPPTKPHLPHFLLVPLPVDQTFKHMSLWGAFLFRLPQTYAMSVLVSRLRKFPMSFFLFLVCFL